MGRLRGELRSMRGTAFRKLGRPLPEPGINRERAAVSGRPQTEGRSGLRVRDCKPQVARVMNLMTVEAQNYVPRAQARPPSRASTFDFGNQRSFRLVQPQAACLLLRYLLKPDAEPASRHFSLA